MKRRKSHRLEKRRVHGRRRPIALAACILTALIVSGVILAGGPSRFGSGNAIPGPQGGPFSAENPSKEYFYAGGRLLATEEASTACGSPPSTPASLTATPEFAPQLKVTLTWPASANADHYEVQRSQSLNSFVTLTPKPTTNSFDDFTVGLNTAYIYRVRAVDAQELCPSAYSNVDLATTTNFTESVAIGVPIKAIHLSELFTAVNAVRVTAGLGAFTWTPTPAPAVGGAILKDHVQKLRSNLNAARSSLGLSPQSFSNDPLTQGVTVVRAVHIQELRDGVK